MSEASQTIECPAPAFGDDAVVLAFAANDYYVPYLSTLLHSIAQNASEERCYDMLVLHTDISEHHQELMKQHVETQKISLRFFNTEKLMEGYKENLYLRGHFKVETYYRLLLQIIMPEYSKVLYLDSDMVVQADVAELYDTPLDGYLVAAVQDPDTAGLYNGYLPNKKAYMDYILALSDPYGYFQAGTVLFNLDEFRRTYEVEELFEYAQSREWELLDQDVLNHFCDQRVKYVDMRWNVMMDMEGMRRSDIIALAPQELIDAYDEAHANPSIIHYAGPEKPWTNPECDFAEVFWSYARNTPFYEVALTRMCNTVLNVSVKAEERKRAEERARAEAARQAEAALTTRPQKAKDKVWAMGVRVLPYGSLRRNALGFVYRKIRRRG